MVSLSSASSSLMPTMVRPLAPYFTRRSSRCGNDFLHGSQNVPQKSTSTTLPRSLLSAILPLPLAAGATVKSGAFFPTRPFATGVVPDDDSAPPPPHPASGATTRRSVTRETWVRIVVTSVLPHRNRRARRGPFDDTA